MNSKKKPMLFYLNNFLAQLSHCTTSCISVVWLATRCTRWQRKMAAQVL